jgi:hypothetical protein
MHSLRIIRDSGYADRFRAYRIVLDGKHIGKIKDGETKELPIPSGQHNLSIRVDWLGSKTLQFTNSDGEVVTFCVRSNLRGARLLLQLWYVFFAWNSYLHLEQVI